MKQPKMSNWVSIQSCGKYFDEAYQSKDCYTVIPPEHRRRGPTDKKSEYNRDRRQCQACTCDRNELNLTIVEAFHMDAVHTVVGFYDVDTLV